MKQQKRGRRNGTDALSVALSGLACVLLLPAVFAAETVRDVLWVLAFICLAGCYFRIFSRNVARRQKENQWFRGLLSPFYRLRSKYREKRRQKKLYCFFQCPECAQVLRVPRGKGHIRVTCKKCGHVFERNS